jgi:hypothetical protein
MLPKVSTLFKLGFDLTEVKRHMPYYPTHVANAPPSVMFQTMSAKALRHPTLPPRDVVVCVSVIIALVLRDIGLGEATHHSLLKVLERSRRAGAAVFELNVLEELRDELVDRQNDVDARPL